MATKLKCRLCRAELKGVFLSFPRKHSFHSFSDIDRNSFDIKNMAYECGCEDCKTLVCQHCLSKLQYGEEGLPLFKKKYAICPKCKGRFDTGGSRFLVEGRFSAGVMTEVLEDQYGTPKMVFSDDSGGTYRDTVGYSGSLPQVCSLCMTSSVYKTVRDTNKHYLPTSTSDQMMAISTPVEYPLCQACHNLLSHPAVENPGSAYGITWEIDSSLGIKSQISIKDPTGMSYSPKGMYFVNPDYAELARKSKD